MRQESAPAPVPFGAKPEGAEADVSLDIGIIDDKVAIMFSRSINRLQLDGKAARFLAERLRQASYDVDKWNHSAGAKAGKVEAGSARAARRLQKKKRK